jgi:hypothetical protein
MTPKWLRADLNTCPSLFLPGWPWARCFIFRLLCSNLFKGMDEIKVYAFSFSSILWSIKVLTKAQIRRPGILSCPTHNISEGASAEVPSSGLETSAWHLKEAWSQLLIISQDLLRSDPVAFTHRLSWEGQDDILINDGLILWIICAVTL